MKKSAREIVQKAMDKPAKGIRDVLMDFVDTSHDIALIERNQNQGVPRCNSQN